MTLWNRSTSVMGSFRQRWAERPSEFDQVDALVVLVGMEAWSKLRLMRQECQQNHIETAGKKLDIFQRLRRRRGQEAITEGALLDPQSLNGEPWDPTENIEMDRMDTEHAFTELLGRLDALHKCTIQRSNFPEGSRISTQTL